MPPPDYNNPNDVLGKKLEELESLLENDNSDNTANKIEIPILDELVTEADFVDAADATDLAVIDEQITELAEKLEQKFSGELDQLVRLLKDNLKHSIVEELRTQANINQDELENNEENSAEEEH